jgi:hypothetical protein
MSLYQYAAAVDGFRKAHGAEDDAMPAPSVEEFQQALKEHGA